MASLERQVEALQAQVEALTADLTRFTNESMAETDLMVDLVSAVGDLQQAHLEIEANHSETQRHLDVVDHFMRELRPESLPGAPRSDEVAMARQVAEGARPSVVKVRAELDGGTRLLGTGWVWDEDHVVTAAHVVSLRSVQRLVVTTFDGRTVEGRLVNASSEQDTALLHVPGLGIPALAVGDASSTRVGDLVVAIGHPQGYASWAVSLGRVSQVAPNAAGPRFQSTAPIGQGNSGGPVFDAQGRVAGMTIAGIWPSIEEAPASAAGPIHVHIAPLATAAEVAVHVPVDVVAGLVALWQGQQ